MRKLIAVLTAILLLSVGVRNAWGVVQYTVTNLGSPVESHSFYAGGINNAGQIAGRTYDGQRGHPFLWSSGTFTPLPILGGLGGQDGVGGINDSGQMVGSSNTADNLHRHAVLWSGGTITDLGTLVGYDGYTSDAIDINNAGQIVGSSVFALGSGNHHAALWSGGSITDLGTLGGTYSYAHDINNVGQIVGSAWIAAVPGVPESSVSHAVLWSNGSITDLGILGGGTFKSNSSATGINDSGQIVGYCELITATNASHTYGTLWSGGSILELPHLFQPASPDYSPTAINNAGQIVGREYDGSREHALLWSGGSVRDLETVVDSSYGYTFEAATNINDLGQIVVRGKDQWGRQRDFLLTPESISTGLYWAPAVGGGGTSTWNSTSSVWAQVANTQGTYAQGTSGPLVFAGTSGVVTVSGTVSVAAGMQFTTNGYTIAGNTPATVVLAGSSAGVNTVTVESGLDATISASLAGVNGLTKAGNGTLTLSGISTCSGGTIISAGTLQGNTTSLQGSVTNNATLVFNQTANGTYAGTINGAGTVGKSGNGRLMFNSINVTSGPIVASQGTLTLPNGLAGGGPISISYGATVEATALVKRAVSGVGTVAATGGLFIGDSKQAGQFNQGGAPGIGGTLNVGGNAVVILSTDSAILGTQTNISPGGSLTTLYGAQLGNPSSLDTTKVLTATGDATINGDFVNNGIVNGPTGAGQWLEFTQDVKGAGSTTGNIHYAGSYSPGNSPAIVHVQNILFDPTSVLIMEYDGLIPGSDYDQLDISGMATLDGTLDLVALDGFMPSAGDRFDLFNGSTTGSFSRINLPSLSNGLSWDTSDLYTTGVVSVVPEPASLVLLAVGVACLAGCDLRRRRKPASEPTDQDEAPAILSFPPSRATLVRQRAA